MLQYGCINCFLGWVMGDNNQEALKQGWDFLCTVEKIITKIRDICLKLLEYLLYLLCLAAVALALYAIHPVILIIFISIVLLEIVCNIYLVAVA